MTKTAVEKCRMGDILRSCVVHHSPMDYAHWPCQAETERRRQAIMASEIVQYNVDGSPCWCDRGQGHSRECAERYAVWRAAQ